MGRNPPTRADRDANLDALKKAVGDYVEKEKASIENEVKYMRAVLKGRGAEKAATKNLAKTSALTAAAVNDYLRFR